jgi:hypothetical protein
MPIPSIFIKKSEDPSKYGGYSIPCTPQEPNITQNIGNAGFYCVNDSSFGNPHATIEWSQEQNVYALYNCSANFGTYYRIEKNQIEYIQYGQFIIIGDSEIVFNKMMYQGNTVYVLYIMERFDSTLSAQYLFTSPITIVIGRTDMYPRIQTISIDDSACSKLHLVATFNEKYVAIKDWGGSKSDDIEENGEGSKMGTWVSIVDPVHLKHNMELRMGKRVFMQVNIIKK